MKDAAGISYRGGWTMLPAGTPYEMQLVHDHIQRLVSQYGDIDLRLNGADWVVKRPSGEPPNRCSMCGVGLGKLVYTRSLRNLCPSCAKHSLR